MALQNVWTEIHLKTVSELRTELIEQDPMHIVFDTETTGLHLLKDNMFILTFSMIGKKGAYAYSIDTDLKEAAEVLIRHTQTKDGFFVGHNILFDLCMFLNSKVRLPENLKYMDTMTLIRLGTDAIQVEKGGAPLKLKDYASRYIEKAAKDREKKVSSERQKIAKHYNALLFKDMSPIKKRRILKVLSEAPNDIDDLDPEDRETYEAWTRTLPKRLYENMTGNFVSLKNVPYDMVDREILLDYARYDVIYTYEIFQSLYPIVLLRKQEEILKRENRLTMPLLRMIRVGFKINKPYVSMTKVRMKQYIKERIMALKYEAKSDVTCNQSKKLLAILQEHDDTITSTNKVSLNILMDTIDEDEDLETKTMVGTIIELRTLIKWYKTYLIRFHKAMQFDDYIYTGINSAGTITGRFTSDFQQFPKKAIKDIYGQILFHPREMVCAHSDDSYLLYIDYSQIELRIQAIYTILLGHPDMNLCRAYMPYKCYHYRTNITFDYNDPKHLKNWDRKREGTNISVWCKEEDGTSWVATDVHGATTKTCYPDMDPLSELFAEKRGKVGKPLNFACNYGAGPSRILEMFYGITMEEAVRRHKAYKDTFPGVAMYNQWCKQVIGTQGYGENLFGRRYYNTTSHNYANAAIQGSGADLLKMKLIELDQYIIDNKLDTKIQMNIHDEICFIMPVYELHYYKELKRIMEDIPDTIVPIVAECEISDSTWAKKKGFELTTDGHVKYHVRPN